MYLNSYISTGVMTTTVAVNTFSKGERKYFQRSLSCFFHNGCFVHYFIYYFSVICITNICFRFSMEAHAVHYNQKYGNFKDAVSQHDGLAVVAFFLQATDDLENICFKKLSKAVKNIVKINSVTSVPSGKYLILQFTLRICTYQIKTKSVRFK